MAKFVGRRVIDLVRITASAPQFVDSAGYHVCYRRMPHIKEVTVQRHPPEPILTCLWELANGTRALVVEHSDAPRWELRLVRHGQLLQGCRCDTLADLMARSLTEFTASAAA